MIALYVVLGGLLVVSVALKLIPHLMSGTVRSVDDHYEDAVRAGLVDENERERQRVPFRLRVVR